MAPPGLQFWDEGQIENNTGVLLMCLFPDGADALILKTVQLSKFESFYKKQRIYLPTII